MTEIEKLRGLLDRTVTEVGRTITPELRAAIDAALSPQAEPCEFHDCDQPACQQYSGQVPCEPAPAQDDREAFEASFKTLEAGLSLDGIYVLHMAKEIYWQGWQARAARPAQAEQQSAEAEVAGEWEWLKLAAEVAEEDGPWEPRLGMTDCETAFAQSASPTKVLELIAALSAVTAERDAALASLERAYANYNQVSYASTERGKQIDQLRAEVEALREAFGECIQSLHDEMLQSYGGQKPNDMHPVTRRNYDRDMAEIAEYRAALSAQGATP